MLRNILFVLGKLYFDIWRETSLVWPTSGMASNKYCQIQFILKMFILKIESEVIISY